MTYKPLRFFIIPGIIFFSFGFLIGLRFLYHYFSGNGSGYIQSLILGALLMGLGFFFSIVGLVTDLIAVNRILLEKIDKRIWKIEDSL